VESKYGQKLHDYLRDLDRLIYTDTLADVARIDLPVTNVEPVMYFNPDQRQLGINTAIIRNILSQTSIGFKACYIIWEATVDDVIEQAFQAIKEHEYTPKEVIILALAIKGAWLRVHSERAAISDQLDPTRLILRASDIAPLLPPDYALDKDAPFQIYAEEEVAWRKVIEQRSIPSNLQEEMVLIQCETYTIKMLAQFLGTIERIGEFMRKCRAAVLAKAKR
jgi:hypothetical protein